MRRVLVVAYYFPPSGGPGVQRVLKMIRYLPQFGWEPVVLTVRQGTFPARDESLLAEVPATLHVERTRILEPYVLYRRLTGTHSPIDVSVLTDREPTSWRQRLAQWIRATLFIPDARVGWLLDAVPAGVQLIKRFGIAAIYTSSPPYTCALIGRALQRRTNTPWVMELRDPWTNFLTTPRRWVLPRLFDRHLERSCFERANRIIAAWDGIVTDALGKYPHLSRDKFVVIPNGFDSADYPPTEPSRNSALTITYTGSLYGLRNPGILVTALERLTAEGEIPRQHVLLRLVGRVGDDVVRDLDASPLRDRIEIIPYVPHHESIRYLLESDIALLVVDRSSDSTTIVPGKVFEYLGAAKPVLALAPHDSAIEALLEETCAGSVCANVEECAATVVAWYRLWANGELLVHPNAAAITRYERRSAARHLAAVFDQLAATRE
ncbi:MAG: glycosyltransferase family 4 protein [Chlorobi bacterium]|nr:glycosyltransferase family 4 protein [Chlorobiota bacterium]